MVGSLEGKIIHTEIGFVILGVGGVGYKVHIPINMSAEVEASVRLWTHLAVREDALDLYGFEDRESLNFFEMLIKISGIGPKSALNIISISSLANLKQAVSEGDLPYLTKISGIGRKTAEKIVLELRDKIPAGGSTVGGGKLREETDALEALESLGYSRKEAQDALRAAGPGTASVRVKEALKILGKS
ncbi:MAG: Holliday junction DNA helicase RuvA [Candidatus Yanofskybacteria bacterium RIFCSPLOWO2_02_FULL_47_9b]|uniref:Holliday junction branch migration complex subunit RuvA n=1 Tax=Candidatus Yanofskybacteria bacterium RIFCSPLOWO2_02_FULL_47_9b TaxID=1802708 RepID=A0A1F8H750_9BACT|nr:MAG: Holliday junction DNA helicase RuvA [Candidatus Yanofskybacteria bacterium RIFCSPLOWO2_02_FULL_47_9b]